MENLGAFEGKRVLVTGGAGFVGSCLVRRLIELRALVTVLDSLETGRRENLDGLEGYAMVEGSVTDGSLVKRLVQDAEIVIHGAARNILLSTRNPRSDFEVNIGGTLNVLLAARESRGARIVYTSSASIYGNPRYLPVNEDEPPSLVSPYAVSKFSGESYCQAFYESYGVPSTVVRYSNVFGPGQDPSNPYCGVVAKFFQAVLTGEPLAIHGDGQQTRDFTFIEDAVEATLVAALSPRAVGEVFNVGTGFETSVSALAETIMQVLNQRVEIRHIDRRDIDNIRRRVLNIEKIRRMLHWVPRFTLREGLERTWQWQRRPDRARSST